jgi:hypothetical protein
MDAWNRAPMYYSLYNTPLNSDRLIGWLRLRDIEGPSLIPVIFHWRGHPTEINVIWFDLIWI